MKGSVLCSLRTVFLDDGEEREGDNIVFNLGVLANALHSKASPCLRTVHSDPDDDYGVTYARLVQETLENDSALLSCSSSSSSLVPMSQHLESSLRGQHGHSSRHLSLHADVKEGSFIGSGVMMGTSPAEWHSSRSLLHGTELFTALISQSDGNRPMADVRCPHCKLLRDDLPFYAVPVVDGGRRNPNVPIRRYGNLALGITDPQLADEQLWLAVAKLYVPAYAALSAEQAANACKDHFTQSVGIPPWIECFIAADRKHQRQVERGERTLALLQERNEEIHCEIARLSKTLQSARTMRDLVNPDEEREKLLGQLQIARVELVDRQWQVNETRKKNNKDNAQLVSLKALIALRMEEVRRLLLSIGELYWTAKALDSRGVAKLQLPEKLNDVLQALPSLEFGRSTRRQQPTAAAARRVFQCRDCLLLTATSPYCTVTGLLHADQEPGEEPSEESIAAYVRVKGVEPPPAQQPNIAPQRQSLTDILPNPATPLEGSTKGSSSAGSPVDAELLAHTPNGQPFGRKNTRMSSGGPFDDDIEASPSTAEGDALSPPSGEVDTFEGGQHRNSSSTKLNDVDEPPAPILDEAAEKKKQQQQETRSIVELIEICSQHMQDFLEAAAQRDFKKMKGVMDTIDAESGIPSTLANSYPPVATALLDIEEKFLEWYRVVCMERVATPPPQPTQHQIREAQQMDVEQRIFRLKKELRELQHAFAKRPNTRNQGFNLDDEAFMCIVNRAMELDRKNHVLKVRLRPLVETVKQKQAALPPPPIALTAPGLPGGSMTSGLMASPPSSPQPQQGRSGGGRPSFLVQVASDSPDDSPAVSPTSRKAPASLLPVALSTAPSQLRGPDRQSVAHGPPKQYDLGALNNFVLQL